MTITELLSAVRAADRDATKGEWRTEPDPGYECDECGALDVQHSVVRAANGGGIAVVLVHEKEDGNARLIALYRTACPELADEVERLEAECERLDAKRERLQGECEWLRRELTAQRENNERRNRELDALHYVWCSGGCTGGVHRYCGGEPLTEEIVTEIERQAKRAREWLTAHDSKGDNSHG